MAKVKSSKRGSTEPKWVSTSVSNRGNIHDFNFRGRATPGGKLEDTVIEATPQEIWEAFSKTPLSKESYRRIRSERDHYQTEAKSLNGKLRDYDVALRRAIRSSYGAQIEDQVYADATLPKDPKSVIPRLKLVLDSHYKTIAPTPADLAKTISGTMGLSKKELAWVISEIKNGKNLNDIMAELQANKVKDGLDRIIQKFKPVLDAKDFSEVEKAKTSLGYDAAIDKLVEIYSAKVREAANAEDKYRRFLDKTAGKLETFLNGALPGVDQTAIRASVGDEVYVRDALDNLMQDYFDQRTHLGNTRKDLNDAKDELAALTDENDEIKETAGDLADENGRLAQDASDLSTEKTRLENELTAEKARKRPVVWPWVLTTAAAGILGVAGIIYGVTARNQQHSHVYDKPPMAEREHKIIFGKPTNIKFKGKITEKVTVTPIR